MDSKQTNPDIQKDFSLCVGYAYVLIQKFLGSSQKAKSEIADMR